MSIDFSICSTQEDFEAAFALDSQLLTDAGLKPKFREDRQRLWELGNLLLVKDGTKVVGFNFFELENGKAFHVTLGLHPDYRRRGIGDRFMPYLGAYYRSRGASQIIIYFPSNDGGQPQFYKRWHCDRIGQEVVQGVPFDVYVYHLIGPVRTEPKEA